MILFWDSYIVNIYIALHVGAYNVTGESCRIFNDAINMAHWKPVEDLEFLF